MNQSQRLLALALALALLSLACSDDTEPQLARDAGAADAAADAVKPITFPEDEAPHQEQMEWWYYTGRLTTQAKGVYGFELTVFRPRVAGKHIHVVHLAFTDLVKKTYACEMQVTGEALPTQPAGGGFWIKVGKTEIKGHAGKDNIKGALPGYALDLALSAVKPVTLQYGTGWMLVGSNAPFYYYSYTDMAATGTLTAGGKTEAVTGKVWMDHQWGTIGNGYAWDWFSLRLDDGSDLMLFNVKREDGKPGFSGGTLVSKDGKATVLKAAKDLV